LDILEEEWNRLTHDLEGNLPQAHQTAELASWFVLGFNLGLRGEEMALIEHAGTSEGLKDLAHNPPYFSVVITGPTKGVFLFVFGR
jgi:hypothetical protein